MKVGNFKKIEGVNKPYCVFFLNLHMCVKEIKYFNQHIPYY